MSSELFGDFVATGGRGGMPLEQAAETAPTDGKPICGSDAEVGEYDLPLHVAALFLVMLASLFGAGFPVAAKKLPWLKVPKRAFFICKHFGTGVLVATAFVHLLPVAFGNLTDPCLPDLFTDQYPAMPGVIMMGSMFCLFVLEMWINSKVGGHSHGGAMGFESHPKHGRSHGQAVPPPRPPRYTAADHDFGSDDIDYKKQMAKKMYEENIKAYEANSNSNPFGDENEIPANVQSEMPAWFVVFYEQYVRQRLELVKMIRANNAPRVDMPNQRNTIPPAPGPVIDSPYIDPESGRPVDPMVFKKMSMNITLLEGGILFHSVFVGMTISITIDGFVILLVAILFHQMFEGLGLGSRIAEVPYKKGSIRPWVLVFAFGLTCPFGQAIGLAVKDTYDPNSAFGLIVVGVFNAISSGLLLYAALVDLLAEDFLSEEAQVTLTGNDRKAAFFWVMLGAAGMSVVGAFA